MSRVLLVVPGAHRRDFAELVGAWQSHGMDVRVETYADALPDVSRMVETSDDLDALLLAGSARRAPATALPAPIAHDCRGRKVPISWLPITTSEDVQRFARAAARVHGRAVGKGAVALLGQWHPRYLRVVDRLTSLLEERFRTLRWTADVITRDAVVRGLGSGLGVGLYVGHGRPNGWVGYHGMRGHHFDAFDGEPLGTLMSLACRTASRRRTGLSYAEALPLRGVAAATFGATSDTKHTDNTRWAVGVCDALAAGATTVGELIVRAAPASPDALAAYRLIGDPMAPLTTWAHALRRASAIPVYP